MSATVEGLLLRWEEQRRRGNTLTIEELCRDHPQLRDELCARIAVLQRMDGVLNLSSAGDSAALPGARRTRYDELQRGWEPIPGYRLERRLGEGGYGVVWEALGPGGFGVALKFVSLSSRLGASEARSLEVLKQLHHPNLLAVFGAWQAHGFLVIATELAEQTLLKRLHEVQAQGATGIPLREVLRYVRDAAKGIDYLNLPDRRPVRNTREPVQHRDIKPENLLLMGGSVKISDFGLSQILKNTVGEHTGCLTRDYAAPEFFQGHTTRTSDQYSLAVTYCHLRGGRLPFTGNPGRVVEGHLKGTPDLTMLPPDERGAVERALQKDPAARWPSCTAFVHALIKAAIRRSAPTGAPTPGGTRWRSIALFLIAVLLHAIVIAFLAMAHREL